MGNCARGLDETDIMKIEDDINAGKCFHLHRLKKLSKNHDFMCTGDYPENDAAYLASLYIELKILMVFKKESYFLTSLGFMGTFPTTYIRTHYLYNMSGFCFYTWC